MHAVLIGDARGRTFVGSKSTAQAGSGAPRLRPSIRAREAGAFRRVDPDPTIVAAAHSL